MTYSYLLRCQEEDKPHYNSDNFLKIWPNFISVILLKNCVFKGGNFITLHHIPLEEFQPIEVFGCSSSISLLGGFM